MCGIFGFIASNDSKLTALQKLKITNTLFSLSQSRGQQASGVATLSNSILTVLKSPQKASIFITTPLYKNLFVETQPPIQVIIGQTRLETHGTAKTNSNNQPVIHKNTLAAVHNGVIINYKELWKLAGQKTPPPELDTKGLLAFIDCLLEKGLTHKQALNITFTKIEGSASIALLSSSADKIFLATNTGSLYLTQSSIGVIFASEKYTLESLFHIHPWIKRQGKNRQVKAMSSCSIELNISQKKTHNSYSISDISPLTESPEKPSTQNSQFTNKLSDLKKHSPPYDQIASIPRCRKCILPSTMPFITFDPNGVCSYCRDHKKITYKGRKAFEEHVNSIISENDQSNCLMPFSGGRDSAYGLHYLKKVLGLNPIAYTYDWGMVTDLARRNQARLVSKLGIEHIIVSADIEKKHDNIRKNIQAWIKNPTLGMVPLFMAGDKQAEYFAEKVSRQTKTPLIIYCRGNELENEEFKFGHAGIKNGSPNGVIHHLSSWSKVKMATYYAKQYLHNPAYLNSSLTDSLAAYYTTYLKKHQFTYLWHFIPWNENEIITTLKKLYNWETPSDTSATWRIDDGTVPFYNYIYLTVQGFTENDTFRSNQIREGLIDRKKALSLANQENQPRYESLQWYFETLKLDGHQVLTVIDHMTKLY